MERVTRWWYWITGLALILGYGWLLWETRKRDV